MAQLGANLDGIQVGLDTIGEPLHATTFVVVDLETTGTSAASGGITEIGAVKTRGGQVIGEFHTLINPGRPIPPLIVSLTGITEAMVAPAPRIEQVLPSLLEFMGDAVLVAHNAPFDIGFLKAACRLHDYRWPGNEVVDTLTLARRATTKEEAPNKKLSTLARVFGASVTPNHRALDDARATADVLHGLLERLAHFGITHREDLDTLRNPVPETLRRKAPMADAVPAAPGVYIFRGPQGERLYVGTSKNLRSRVKSYFTRAEQRRPIRDMLALAVSVDWHVCATELEARVVELRLITQYRPRYNRRSARPERTTWIALTEEPYPRLKVQRAFTGHGCVAGPFHGVRDATNAIEALQAAFGVRTCTTRLPATPPTRARACLLYDVGQCAAPCLTGAESGYATVITQASDALRGDPSPVVEALTGHIDAYVEKLDFERAAHARDAVAALVEASIRRTRLEALDAVRLIAARRNGLAFDVVSVVDGVLMGSARVRHGVWTTATRLREDWDEPVPEPTVEERELVAVWLESPGTRVVMIEGEWSYPVAAAGRHAAWANARYGDREALALPSM